MLLFLVSCNNKEVSAPAPNLHEASIPADFLAFYDHFHRDSLFQVEHVIFPLTAQQDGTPWLKENWRMHRPFDSMNGEFSRQFNNLNGIIIEIMQDKTATVTIERRYSKMSGEYHLIYYVVSSKFGE